MIYSLTLPDHLVQEAKELIDNNDMSLDQFFSRAIFKRVYELKTRGVLEERIKHASIEDALDILDQLFNQD